ncbi:MAG: hypothetical protein DGJ47_000406 [Rickettsiaceae bacterium]
MKNKYYIILAIISVLCVNVALAFWSSSDSNNEIVYNKSITFHNKQFEQDVIVNGSAHLIGAKFADLTVNGSLKGKNLEGKELTVNGAAKIIKISADNATFNGKVFVSEGQVNSDLKANGFISAEKLKVGGEIEITGSAKIKDSELNEVFLNSKKRNKAVFSNTTIKNITIMDKTKLTLTNKSVIQGRVYFELAEGKVYLSKDSKIMGKVENGEIIQLKD